MENVILGLLIFRALTLYELNQAFKQGISMFYSASYGSLQIAVKNLLQRGWIVFEERVEKGRNKKVYSITELGRQAFYNWMFSEVPLNKLETTALSKVYFLGLIEDAAQKRQIVQGVIGAIEQVQKQLDTLNDTLNQVGVPPTFQQIFKYQMKTLEYGRQAYIFSKEWFQNLLSDL